MATAWGGAALSKEQAPATLFAPPTIGQSPPMQIDSQVQEPTGPAVLPRLQPADEAEFVSPPTARAAGSAISPRQFEPRAGEWWDHEVMSPASNRQSVIPVDVGTLMEMAIRCSEQVKAVGVTRWIRQEQTVIADAEFDAEVYADGRFDDTSEPVGNTLTTGGPPRLIEHNVRLESGLRRKTYGGASVSLSQQLGHDNSNSLFFVPNDQGNARMSLEMRQPLLAGRGREYNQSFVVETVFLTEQAEADYLQALQDRLFEVGAAYWSLYRARATLAQQCRHVDRAAGIAEELEHRQILDALQSQVLRARAALATRRSDLAVAAAEVRNAEARIRALVNAAILQCKPMPELVPSQPPPEEDFPMHLAPSVSDALCRRPEMRALAAQLRAANVRTAQAANQTLPSLDLVLESYVIGLAGNSQVAEAWRQQFTEGAPSYAVGIQYSTPFGNRAAQSRLRQRQFDQSRIGHLLKDQSDQIRSEVEIALRNVAAAYQTVQARKISVDAVNAEMDLLSERWKRLRGDPNLGQLQLDDLLNAQVRLFEEEKALAAAQAAYGVSQLEVQRATGILVSGASCEVRRP